MPFVKAKCTQCGEILTIDDEAPTWRCRYCGSTFSTEEAVNSFNGASSEFVIRNGILRSYRGSSTEVVIPDAVTAIGDHAFENHSEITYVFMPESVNAIGNYAFLGCTGLTRIYIPRIGYSDNGTITGLADYIASKLKIYFCIGKGAFGGCTGLNAVEINTRAEKDRERYINIHPTAFAGCTNLTSVSIGYSISKLLDGVFDSCDDTTVFDWAYLHLFPNCAQVVRERARTGRCIYCGGKMGGLFTKKCKDCGRQRRV